MIDVNLLGMYVRDKVTGLEGYVTGAVEYKYGCTRYIVTEPGKNIFGAVNKIHLYESQIDEISSRPRLEISKTVNEAKYFGQHCKDKDSGFEGICVGRLVSLFSDDMYYIQPGAEGGTLPSGEFLDEVRIETESDSPEPDNPEPDGEKPKGGLLECRIPTEAEVLL